MVGEFITIGGEEYKLKLTANKLIDFKHKFPTMFESMTNGGADIEVLRAIFFFCLSNKENNLKKFNIEKAGDLMSDAFEEGYSIQELSEILVRVVTASMGLSPEDLEKQTTEKGE